MLTPIGVIGGLRGVFFASIGGADFNGQPYKFATSKSEAVHAATGLRRAIRPPARRCPIFGPPVDITGFRLRDGRASYGVGLETFALGFPIHFDWSWRTLFNKDWEDALFASVGRQRGVPASRSSRCGLGTTSN